MIVVDTSAVLAIFLEEPEFERVLKVIAEADLAVIGAPNALEARMVAIGRFGAEGLRLIDRLLADLGLETVEFSNSHAEGAADAFVRFGKGRHRAGLNFGDCMAFALAQALDAQLLFKGNDFALAGLRDLVVRQ